MKKLLLGLLVMSFGVTSFAGSTMILSKEGQSQTETVVVNIDEVSAYALPQALYMNGSVEPAFLGHNQSPLIDKNGKASCAIELEYARKNGIDLLQLGSLISQGNVRVTCILKKGTPVASFFAVDFIVKK